MKKGIRNKIAIMLTIIFTIALFITSINSMLNGNWQKLFVAIGLELALVAPFVINHFIKKRGFIIPSEVISVIMIALFLSFYLGDLCDLYNKFIWWDSMLHFLSGIVLIIAGAYIIDVINVKEKATLITSSFFIVLFSFCFSNTLGVLWEVAEYLTDITGLTVASQSDLQDTMVDMILHLISSVITSVIYYLYRKNRIYKQKYKT